MKNTAIHHSETAECKLQDHLVATGFTFEKDTHATYADVSASELANGYGYTTGGQALTGFAIQEDDTGDKATVTFNDAVFTASGGSIGPTPGAIIFDDTAADDAVVGYIDFSGDRTVTDANPLTVQNIQLDLA
jgi:hypothetical protein